MRIFTDLSSWRNFRKDTDASIGFVPTMGCLHEGHLQLVEEAKKSTEFVVVSIFVNPTQFNSSEDLNKYPRQLEKDIALLEAIGVDALITPSYEELYLDNYRYQIQEKSLSSQLCGAHRPGHFDGVLSVVMKFFQLVKPEKSFFGEKDFQQLLLIEGMVEAFFLDIEIVRVPTVREFDGLAKSSRNLRLSEKARKLAPEIYKNLISSSSPEEVGAKLQSLGFDVDYVEDYQKRRFVAASLESVRLIDNVNI